MGTTKKVNQLKAGAVLSYFSLFLGYAISIGYTPVMIRLLGQSEFGLYNLVASVVSYLGLLSFGFGSAYMRYYSRYKVVEDHENVAKLNGLFISVFSVMGIVAMLAGIVLALNTDLIFGTKLTAVELHRTKILLGIMTFNIATSFPASVFNSNITANEKFVFQKVLHLLKVIVNPFLVLPLLLMGFGSIGMAVAATVLNTAVEISNIVFCFKKLKIKFDFHQLDFSLMKEIAIFSSYIFVNMVIDQINWNIDKFILGRFYGTAVVAVYGLAAQLNSYVVSLTSAISNVFIPRVNKMVALGNSDVALTNLWSKIGRLQFIIISLIFTGLVFFGRPFINIWAGKDYNGSYAIALILITPVIIPLIQNLGIEIQRAKNMHKFRSWTYFFIALGNLALSIPLAKRYGGIGSAVGTAISLIIGNGIAMNWYYHKKIGLNIKVFWSNILKFTPAFIIPTFVGVVSKHYLDLNHVFILIICIISYTTVFAISMWFLGMNRYEKDLIGKPILKIMKKLKLSFR